MTCSQYTKSNVEKSYTFHLGWHTITDKKCKFFYENLLTTKFQKPIYKSYYKNMFNVQKENWKRIYINKIKNIYDKNICEFNFKLFNNILSCNLFLHQCKLRPSRCCDYCQDTSYF